MNSTLSPANQAAIPHLDGPNDMLRGDIFRPADAGLPADADARAIAILLLTAGKELRLETRRRLRRYAVVTLLGDSDTKPGQRDRTQAVATWYVTLLEVHGDLGDDDTDRSWRMEHDDAQTALWANGGEALCVTHAAKWGRHKGRDGQAVQDFEQVAFEGLRSRLDRYDPKAGAGLANWAHHGQQDAVAQEYRATYYPEILPTVFKSRPRVLEEGRRIADAGGDITDKDTHEGIAQKLKGLSAASVKSIVCPTREVSIAKKIGDDGEELGALLPDTTEASPEDQAVDADTQNFLHAKLAEKLTATELDVFLRRSGIYGDEEPVSSIADSYGKSRSWASDQSGKAKAKLLFGGDLLRNLAPSDPSTVVPATRTPWLSAMSTYHAFVGQLVCGIGSRPIALDMRAAAAAAADRLEISVPEVYWLLTGVVAEAKANGTDLNIAIADSDAHRVAKAASAHALARVERTATAIKSLMDRSTLPGRITTKLLRDVDKTVKHARTSSDTDDVLEVIEAARELTARLEMFAA